jgi:hypothetical protein
MFEKTVWTATASLEPVCDMGKACRDDVEIDKSEITYPVIFMLSVETRHRHSIAVAQSPAPCPMCARLRQPKRSANDCDGKRDQKPSSWRALTTVNAPLPIHIYAETLIACLLLALDFMEGGPKLSL